MKMINKDLAPVPQEDRSWGALNYFSLWVGMAVCIPSYMMASGLIAAGMGLIPAVLCVLLGNAIVLIPMLLNGVVGAKYGIPYPIYARASFGIIGSNIPALLRAIVACGWFGIQTWIGGTAVLALIKTIWPGFVQIPNIFPGFMGLSTAGFISFMIFWGFNVVIILKGVDSIKFLETAASPLLLISGMVLLFWAIYKTGQSNTLVNKGFFNGLRAIIDQPSKFQTNAQFWKIFIPGLTGMVGFWATLSLNIPDFTRYAKNQKGQLWGQALGLPITMTLFALIGIMVTRATQIIYGTAIWDPVKVIQRFDSPMIVFISMVVIAIATLSTNVAANVVGPANDFSNVIPTKINFKLGGMITAFIGIIIMPWKLIADPQGYIFVWLIGYSSLLGPIAGILLVDFYILRKQKLQVDDLYIQGGQYSYYRGFNPRAIAAFLIGALPNLPGFLSEVKILSNIPPVFASIYSYAWFAGLFLAGVSYYFLMKLK
ncbi:MAG: NCS1 family nucleobase:cation symporter-1 [Desulfobacteraceae bacterium]|nr:NCS1 family nucleobase:cation symporter-1 [Desulfobacteraceae bacterium]